MMLRIGFIALLFTASQPAAGSDVEEEPVKVPEMLKSGSAFLAQCGTPGSKTKLEECLVYTSALAAATNAADSTIFDMADHNAISGPYACIPDTIPDENLLATAAKYMRAHPELRSVDATDLMTAAWRLAYPCRAPK